MNSENANDVRDSVRAAYTAALKASRTSGRGCCGSSSPNPGAEPAGTAARAAGYPEADRARHAEASASSFGCGNPLAFEAVEPGQIVLDLGSGAGFDLLIAAERVGPGGRVIGVDMTDAMIESAREHVERAGLQNVEVRRGTIESLPVEDASVDWVISNCVINLSPDKNRVFAEIARVLRPGGAFAISDIVAEDVPESVRARAAAYTACIGGAIPEADYVAGLGGAGLEAIEVVDRIRYDLAQLEEMVGPDPGRSMNELRSLVGKVWSAKFRGRRPA
jgi:arsenite methyltransferase